MLGIDSLGSYNYNPQALLAFTAYPAVRLVGDNVLPAEQAAGAEHSRMTPPARKTRNCNRQSLYTEEDGTSHELGTSIHAATEGSGSTHRPNTEQWP